MMYRELKANGFGDIVNFELIRRDWKVDQMRARPQDRMVAHTGFITVARRVVPEEGARGPRPPMPEREE
jgi:tRNA (adenine57-N1/adenine58-N1)-methyltransferase